MFNTFNLTQSSEHLTQRSRVQSAAPLVEALEGRRFLSAAPAPLPAIDASGVLQVAGTKKSDVIVLAVDTTAGMVNVTVNGVLTSVPLASVTGGVRVDAGNGNDNVSVDETAGPVPFSVTMLGGNGKDTLTGGSGDDTLDGGNGNDTLKGMAGNDHLMGGNGKDDLDAGAGDDTCDGGRGKDHILGGMGADHFTGKKEQGEVADKDADDVLDDMSGKTSGGSDASDLLDGQHGTHGSD